MKYTIIGIDFGTSTTVVRVRNYDPLNKNGVIGSILPLKDINGQDSFPTIIFKRKDGTYLCGNEAELYTTRRLGKQEEIIRNFKMDLVSVDEKKRLIAKEYTKQFFIFIKNCIDAQKYDLALEDDIVVSVSVPAKWPKDVRDYMRLIITEVGIIKQVDKVVVVEEPMAASRATLMTHLPDLLSKGIISIGESNVMMIDMGAGTSDIAIFKLNLGKKGELDVGAIVTYPPIDNPNFCGGREIDRMLTDYVMTIAGQSARNNKPRIEYALKLFKEKVLSLSLKQGEAADIREEMYFDSEEFSDLSPITPALFEELTHEHWKKWQSLLNESLREAKQNIGIGTENIDLIILTGGHSNWHFIEDYMMGKEVLSLPLLHFCKIEKARERILCEVNRSATVANGLALGEEMLPFIKTTSNQYAIRMFLGNALSEIKIIARSNEQLPISKDIDFGKTTLSTARDVLIRVELLCGEKEETMRVVTSSEGILEMPDNVDEDNTMCFNAKGLVNIDTDYKVEVRFIATQLDVNKQGTMIGIPKYTGLILNF